jgi:uracil phosphoribosyltransferase
MSSMSATQPTNHYAIEVQHPLIQHHLATLRSKDTSCEHFRLAGNRITEILMTVASQELPTSPKSIQTPMCETTAQVIAEDHKIFLCPILRAGLVMTDVALNLLPMASVYHIGLKRDEETLQAITYYERLPKTFDPSKLSVFILDPMLATGGSALSAIELLTARGIPQSTIKLVSLISAPEGIAFVEKNAPHIQIYTASIDEKLNEKAYIIPGLGDAGDRTFGTLD